MAHTCMLVVPCTATLWWSPMCLLVPSTNAPMQKKDSQTGWLYCTLLGAKLHALACMALTSVGTPGRRHWYLSLLKRS